MRPRVLHVVAGGQIGGAERVVVDLAAPRPGAAADHAVALYTPLPALADFLRAGGVRLHDAGRVAEHPGGYLRRALGPASVHRLAALIRRERITVVHAHTFASQVLATRAARLAGVPIVRTEHSARVYRDRFCWPFSRWSLHRVDAVVAVSAYVGRLALARAPWLGPKLTVIRNGVSEARVAAADAAANAARPRDAGPFRFIAACRLVAWKGLDLALAALARVPGAHLDIVGDGEERAHLERCARAAGVAARVTFHGYVADPMPLVAAADAAISSAVDEGLSLSLLEAMAAARPAVAVPVGGIPEIVRDGDTGWLAAARDVPALAAAMTAAAADRTRARAAGARARAFVHREHTMAAMRAAYDDLYTRLTG